MDCLSFWSGKPFLSGLPNIFRRGFGISLLDYPVNLKYHESWLMSFRKRRRFWTESCTKRRFAGYLFQHIDGSVMHPTLVRGKHPVIKSIGCREKSNTELMRIQTYTLNEMTLALSGVLKNFEDSGAVWGPTQGLQWKVVSGSGIPCTKTKKYECQLNHHNDSF